MGREVGIAEGGGAPFQERLRLVLRQPFAAALRLVGVADVCELERRARSGEQPAELERVAVRVGSVVGDEDLRHLDSARGSLPRDRRRAFAGIPDG